MTKQELFVKYHWKQSIILGLLVIMVVGLQVFLEEIKVNKENKTGKVLGIMAQQSENNKPTENILLYQNNVKQIINNYLKQRADFIKPHQNWLFLINQTKQKLILLETPNNYKDLQIKIIILLDAEKIAVEKSAQQEIEKINKEWDQLLTQFFWLN